MGSVFRQMFICCALSIVCNTYTTVGRSIADIHDARQYIFIKAWSTKVNILPRSYIEATDRPTVLIVLYSTVCATDKPFAWKHFPKWCHFCPKSIYVDVGPCLRSYSCAITIIILHVVPSVNCGLLDMKLFLDECKTLWGEPEWAQCTLRSYTHACNVGLSD